MIDSSSMSAFFLYDFIYFISIKQFTVFKHNASYAITYILICLKTMKKFNCNFKNVHFSKLTQGGCFIHITSKIKKNHSCNRGLIAVFFSDDHEMQRAMQTLSVLFIECLLYARTWNYRCNLNRNGFYLLEVSRSDR